jgi:hypothetical protein
MRGWSARQSRPRDQMSRSPAGGSESKNVLSEEASAALAAVLDPTERVDLVAPAVGSFIVLTQRRLVVVRDGASFRPKTGVRSFDLGRGLGVRIGPGRRRVIIESDGRTINVFVRAEQLEQAEALVVEVRRRIYLED